MITASPRAGRSHRFGLNSFICRCGRPLRYFEENGWGYCSASWTGRRVVRPETASWGNTGFAGYYRVGDAWSFWIGPCVFVKAGRIALLDLWLFKVGVTGRQIGLTR